MGCFASGGDGDDDDDDNYKLLPNYLIPYTISQ
jgi:hypothetical protein